MSETTGSSFYDVDDADMPTFHFWEPVPVQQTRTSERLHQKQQKQQLQRADSGETKRRASGKENAIPRLCERRTLDDASSKPPKAPILHIPPAALRPHAVSTTAAAPGASSTAPVAQPEPAPDVRGLPSEPAAAPAHGSSPAAVKPPCAASTAVSRPFSRIRRTDGKHRHDVVISDDDEGDALNDLGARAAAAPALPPVAAATPAPALPPDAGMKSATPAPALPPGVLDAEVKPEAPAPTAPALPTAAAANHQAGQLPHQLEGGPTLVSADGDDDDMDVDGDGDVEPDEDDLGAALAASGSAANTIRGDISHMRAFAEYGASVKLPGSSASDAAKAAIRSLDHAANFFSYNPAPELMQPALYDLYTKKPEDLALAMSYYAVGATRKDGQPFLPRSLLHKFRRLRACIIRENVDRTDKSDSRRPCAPDFVVPNLLDKKDKTWGKLWRAIDGRGKTLASQGVVQQDVKRAKVITSDMLQYAHDSGLLDVGTPSGLQNRVLLAVGIVGMFRGDELHKLEASDCHCEPAAGPNGKARIDIMPRRSKNYQGGLADAQRPAPVKVFTDDGEADGPYQLLRLYLDKLRLSEANATGAPCTALFRKANPSWQSSGRWYCSQRLSKATLTDHIKALFPANAGVSSHSLKRTGGTALANDPDFAQDQALRQKVGGWKCVSSMRSYEEHSHERMGAAATSMMTAIRGKPSVPGLSTAQPFATATQPCGSGGESISKAPTLPCPPHSVYSVAPPAAQLPVEHALVAQGPAARPMPSPFPRSCPAPTPSVDASSWVQPQQSRPSACAPCMVAPQQGTYEGFKAFQLQRRAEGFLQYQRFEEAQQYGEWKEYQAHLQYCSSSAPSNYQHTHNGPSQWLPPTNCRSVAAAGGKEASSPPQQQQQEQQQREQHMMMPHGARASHPNGPWQHGGWRQSYWQEGGYQQSRW